MIQRKVVLIGAPGVGKTSLVYRFVESLFSETYLTTIGAKVDRKSLVVNGRDITLMLWDIAGTEGRFSVPTSYVRGASGYLLVADGTRPETLGVGLEMVTDMQEHLADVPGILLLNKTDLERDWRLQDGDTAAWPGTVLRSSAKTGQGVEQAFQDVAAAMLG